ncbi:MAG: DoxX family protein [Planctomycetota bacterium]|jgi:hypothetical protein
MGTASVAAQSESAGVGSKMILSWVARLIAAGVLLIATYPKLIADPQSVALFDTLGTGNAGMYFTGVIETIAIVLLLIPRTAALGGVLGVGLMGGAILSHIAVIGIDLAPVRADHPELADQLPGVDLFVMAIVVLGASVATSWLHRDALLGLLRRGGAPPQ